MKFRFHSSLQCCDIVNVSPPIGFLWRHRSNIIKKSSKLSHMISPLCCATSQPMSNKETDDIQVKARAIINLLKKEQSVLIKAISNSKQSTASSQGGSEGRSTPLDIVFVAAEVAPWSKTGGLGDVMGALPVALASRGHRVMVVSPRYILNDKSITGYNQSGVQDTGVTKELDMFHGQLHNVGFHHCHRDHVDWVFVDHMSYHRNGTPYGDAEGTYSDNLLRFALLCMAAIEAPLVLPVGGYRHEGIPGKPYGQNVTFVANDWHTGLLPVYLESRFKPHNVMNQAQCMLLLHNVAHQGSFPPSQFHQLGLPDSWYSTLDWSDPQDVIKQSSINLLKAAIVSSNLLVAVSQNYAWEISYGDQDCLVSTKKLTQVLEVLEALPPKISSSTGPASSSLISSKATATSSSSLTNTKKVSTIDEVLSLTRSRYKHDLSLTGRGSRGYPAVVVDKNAAKITSNNSSSKNLSASTSKSHNISSGVSGKSPGLNGHTSSSSAPTLSSNSHTATSPTSSSGSAQSSTQPPQPTPQSSSVGSSIVHSEGPHSLLEPKKVPEIIKKGDRVRDRVKVATAEKDIYLPLITTAIPAKTQLDGAGTTKLEGTGMGMGLGGLLRERADALRGVVNGIDTSDWDPSSDKFIKTKYDRNSLHLKMNCKVALQLELGLPMEPDLPLLAFIGRLDYQKGPDLVLDSLSRLVNLGCQVVILGSGAADYEERVAAAEQDFPYYVRGRVGFDVPLSHKLMAGADMLLMPSRFEPCGLNQMYAMRYGTIPIAHSVGGLRDTIDDMKVFEADVTQGTGWTFSPAAVNAMVDAVSAAVDLFRDDQDAWRALQQRGMMKDFSWGRAAGQYESLIKQLAARKNQMV